MISFYPLKNPSFYYLTNGMPLYVKNLALTNFYSKILFYIETVVHCLWSIELTIKCLTPTIKRKNHF